MKTQITANSFLTPLIQLEHITIQRNNKVLLGDLNQDTSFSFTFFQGQHWAILGDNGSGKTTLLKVLSGTMGKGSFFDARIIWTLNGEEAATPLSVQEQSAVVSVQQQEMYLQSGWKITGEELVLTGFKQQDLLYEDPAQEQIDTVYTLAKRFKCEHLLSKKIDTYSQGQLRLLLILRALIYKPKFLFLDEVCDGLDAKTSRFVRDMIDRIALEEQVHLFYVAHRWEDFPKAITHVLHMEKGTVKNFGTLAEMKQLHCSAVADIQIEVDSFAEIKKAPEIIVSLKNADVYIDATHILYSISFTQKKGEHWQVFGVNGSGKSTLLRVLYSDLPVAEGGSIQWFTDDAMQPLPEKFNLWTLREKIGFVSDALQALYTYNITGLEFICSGYFSSIGIYTEISEEQKAFARELAENFGIIEHLSAPIRTHSSGILRRFLLARALVNKPYLLLLDEPFSGLDACSRQFFLTVLNKIAEKGVHLFIISHHKEDIPSCITHRMSLVSGKIENIEIL